VTVILGPFLENDLLHPATYVGVDFLSLSNEQVAATNVELHADMSQKQPTIDCASVLALRSAAPIPSLVRLCPSRRPCGYADKVPMPDRSEQELLAQSAQRAGRLNDGCADVGTTTS
jgi:hypothetical protein